MKDEVYTDKFYSLMKKAAEADQYFSNVLKPSMSSSASIWVTPPEK